MRAVTLLKALFKRGATPPGGSANLATMFELARIDTAHVARYNALLGFAPDTIPLTYYYLLTQRAHLATLLSQDFPFRVAGMVHAENTLTQLQELAVSRPLQLATTVEILPPTSNGARYCNLVTTASQDGVDVFHCTSVYLARQGKRKGVPAATRDTIEGKRIGGWAVGGSLGRAYAKVSGDWNPIHLWRWSARLMGMRRPIIHGMHSVAAACALLEQTSAKRVTQVSARFKAPIALRQRPTLYISGDHHSYCIGLDGRRVVDGTVHLV
ncbi:MAG: MaoC/PaaZ C-terminal domain-containing protein [Massilia sp.]